jgi:hypothetical protein
MRPKEDSFVSLIQLGLVDKTGKLDPHLVQATAAALNVQVTRDLPKFWNVQATVSYVGDPKKVPVGVWPVQLVASLPPGEGGVHLTKHNQPYANVAARPGNEDWCIDASHEALEMLVDPSGNRLQASTSIQIVGGKIEDGTSKFEYLVEACDPCEADKYGYTINGITVSDFITPHFYDPHVNAGTRYSFNGSLTKPREIQPGGYISWLNPDTDHFQQLQYLDPNAPPKIIDLGAAHGASLRAWIDSKTAKDVSESPAKRDRKVLDSNKKHHEALQALAAKVASRY